MFRKRLVIIWVVLMLVATFVLTWFPMWRMPWIVRRLYSSEKIHILTHMFLFAVLAILVASLLWRRADLRGLSALLNWRTLALLALVLLVAVAQEAVQLRARGMTVFRIYEVFDLGVDLIGALAGLMAFHALRSLRARALTPK